MAGNGSYGGSGDGGRATTASLGTPVGMAYGPSGDLYISNFGAANLRKVAAGTGLISTIPPPCYEAPSQIAFDASGKNLYVTYYAGRVVLKLTNVP